ncbi:MAG: thioredoxin domain-containing protein [Terracidiphilus sp.]
MREDAAPTPGEVNLLEHSASAYLRSARHQPVQWHPWGEEAFRRAQAEDKPVLLDIGAVWCHWCHVMDRESYEDPEMAAIVNEHFVAVKVDRDERPDVDARYQAAVSAISGQGGWPLTAFLTPDGRPYFGGTYFPREDRLQRPGFGRVLLTMAQVWRERKDEALESAASVMAAIEHNESFSGRGGELTLALASRIAASALKQFDPRNGGFGSQPKFPHPAALDLLLTEANAGNAEAGRAFTVTLEKMARGGVYDQIGGGFHRYSVDERWVVPHFEKMLYDNTELLRNYLHGFQSFVREDFLETALHIVGWLDAAMTDREHGGFYASQDADIDLEDDGDYFTWTEAEAREALEQVGLDEAEVKLALDYWDIGELGDMHHDPARNVLHVKQTAEELAASQGRKAEEIRALVTRAREALKKARAERPAPFIDRTLYTGWNAMAVSAYLETARLLRMESARTFGLLTLDRILDEAWDGERGLGHVIAYPVGAPAAAPDERAPGTLDDYAFTLHAALDGWLASGEMRYYRAARRMAGAMIDLFYDRTAGAFFDTATPTGGETPLGALAARRKPLQDTPTPAGNPTAAAALLRLEELSGRPEFREIAEDTLASFSGIVEHFGLYAGSYGLALKRLLEDPEEVVIVGSGAEAARFEALAMGRYRVSRTVVRIAPEQLAAAEIPEALAETVLKVPAPDAPVWALVCRGRTCLPPVTTAEALLEELEPAS